ncbi:MarR family winged helix-turn-helix transcriptional regulator [Paracoccus seriniphilus]|uniref:Transcriptional regulator, MarR family n=1 Tax=Paracoccus seriniphilus TaxID=184748 RepID=A0A239PUD3_9RHOB|nr:MarR family transcriptional regulator [Paracoccus seriniphilus]WCR15421.1 MarR family transcriptional regulator [Paracoccus seriniphilus]SNT73911.1 transcriptional regulator, MarR family [Paracoccus seriniphilus]
MSLSLRKQFLPAVIGLHREIRKRFNLRAAALDMTYARAEALVAISANEGITQAELAERLDIRTPSMTRTLDHLEKQGLIERRAVSGDKRMRSLFLTDKAHSQASRVVGFIEELRRELYRDIDPEDLQKALNVIRHLQRNLDRMNG